ncbi:MAG: flagellar biosynthesis repressor FlbT [Flavobacteriaceae bacterium]
MALKVELKPGERIILGTAVITNDNQRTRLFIEGNAPILRQKDIMTSEEATSPARRIYLVVQMIYLESNFDKYREQYMALTKDIVAAAPSMLPHIEAINNEILSKNAYKALKCARRLIAYEEEILTHATHSSAGLQQGREDHLDSA